MATHTTRNPFHRPILALFVVSLFSWLLTACGGGQGGSEEPTDAPKTYAYLYPISQDGLWGFIDSSGTVVIEPQYEGADHFYDGLALVKANGAWGYLKKDGTFQIQPRFRVNPQRFSEGLARARFRNLFGYIDTSGNTVIPDKFKLGLPFHDGLACVQDPTTDKWGFINKKGEWVVEPTMDEFNDYGSGLYPHYTGVGFAFKDTTGKTRIASAYDVATGFRDGLAYVATRVQDGFQTSTTGKFIDTEGKTAVPGTFSRTLGFRHGLAAVEKGGKWGVIDLDGNTIIPFEYDFVGDFDGPLVPVYVGYDSKKLPNMATDALTGDSSSTAKLGYLNQQGQVVYAPTK